MTYLIKRLIISVLTLTAFASNNSASADEVISFDTDSFSMALSSTGRVVNFIDKSSGADYCNQSEDAAFAEVRSGGQIFPAESARYENAQLTVGFKGCDAKAVFRVSSEHRRLSFEVISFTRENVDELLFARVPLTLKGDFSDSFAASPLALNLQVNCLQIPGVNPGVTGFIAYKRFGFEGARAAIVAGPISELRDALKDAVHSSQDIVGSPLGGPWALDAPINRGSYLIAMDQYVTEQSVGGWIEAARALGATQIDLHGGKPFRWGDFEINRDIYPNGRDGLKTVIDTIHNAGMAAGLHTYAFFIAKDAPWVTPVPDHRLATDATFTLSEEISESANSIIVYETTEAISPVTGFQIRNSATIRIDDELITFTGVEKQAPFKFTGCVRGACGTRQSIHAKGAKAFHLKECFGLFVPDGDTDLYKEIADRTADFYNACGFDMIYLDALDGSDIVAGAPFAWRYEALFVDELLRRLNKPAVMEMSTFSHHLWRARSRMEAWDCPARGSKFFVDCHVAHNKRWKNAFMPTQLGWWGRFDWGGIQPEQTFPDNMEYICSKAAATDSGLSYIVGFSPTQIKVGSGQRLAEIARRYEDLRAKGAVSDGIKKQLIEPGRDFTLAQSKDGVASFQPVMYSKQIIKLEKGASTLTFNNSYESQPLRFRLEAPLSPIPDDSVGAKTLLDFNNPGEGLGKPEAQQGVVTTLELPNNAGNPNESEATFTMQNDSTESIRAWAMFRKDFSPPIDFNNMGLGVWITGDGQGEVLNFQVKSPMYLSGGAADHYIHVDFTGRRYFQLVEPEADALEDYEWAHTKLRDEMLAHPSQNLGVLYSTHHFWVNYAQIASLTIGMNNAPKGKTVKVGVGAVKAIPLTTQKLVNPQITIGATTLSFPVEINTGDCLEFISPEDCKLYNPGGECIGEITPTGQTPQLQSGANTVDFHCEEQTGNNQRVKLTLITHGASL